MTITVRFRNPDREVRVGGPKRVQELLRELEVLPELVLVVRGRDLLTRDELVEDGATVELRPVVSGGAA